jgi:hypothetical protein
MGGRKDKNRRKEWERKHRRERTENVWKCTFAI